MGEAHLGFRGPWAPLEELQLDLGSMLQILSLWNFSFVGMETNLNQICPRYVSLAYEWKAI